MKNEFMVAITQVCHERQLSEDIVLEAVEIALVSAYKRNYGGNSISAKIDKVTGDLNIFAEKEVVEDVLDPQNEISLEDAKAIEPDAEMGDVVKVANVPADFGRIAAQTTKQVILQRIREAERDALYQTYAEREGEIINTTVQKVDPHQAILSLGKVEAVLPRSEQIPSERYNAGQRIRAYIAQVNKTPRGPQIIVSRTHRNLLRRLLEVEVPEIYNGTVEIKAIAREAGFRSKVAVAALQEGVDPVGSCVGMRGVRIQGIVNELGGEKIDVAEWSPIMSTFISNALSPAKVLNVILLDVLTNDKTAMVVVPDQQLSLAIGKEGQNARLAAKLTNWRIDIKSATEAALEAIERASASDELKAKLTGRPEVFSLASTILAERAERTENRDLSAGELNLLGEAIELVWNAELALAQEKRDAEKAAKMKLLAEESANLLADAEAILMGQPSDESEETIEAEASEIAETEEVVVAEAETEVAEIVEMPVVAETAEVEVVAEVEVETPTAETETIEEEVEADEEADESLASVLESVISKKPKKKAPKKRLKTIIVDEGANLGFEPPAETKRKTKKRRSADISQMIGKRRHSSSEDLTDWDEYEDFED